MPPTVFDATQEGHPSPVLCVAGRGELDELAAIVAMQLLKKHGLDADLIGYETTLSRARFGEVDLAGASIICVVSLDAAHCPPYLRNLLRRLRQRATTAELIVGLVMSASSWPGDAPVSATSAAKSFRELVDTCIEAARRHLREDASRRGIDAAPGLTDAAPAFTDVAPGFADPDRRPSR
jgi:hypothetical protein